MNKKNKLYILAIFSLATIMFSCKAGDLIRLSCKVNPTTYTFNASLDTLKKIIIKNFDNYQFYNMYLKDYINSNSFSSFIFVNQDNVNDFYIYTHNNLFSKIYFKGKEKLYYSVAFQIHFTVVSKNQVQVQILTHNATVSMGMKWQGADNWGLRVADFRCVPPSTIEEYEILYKIGTAIGLTNMPAINYPDSLNFEVINKKDFEQCNPK